MAGAASKPVRAGPGGAGPFLDETPEAPSAGLIKRIVYAGDTSMPARVFWP